MSAENPYVIGWQLLQKTRREVNRLGALSEINGKIQHYRRLMNDAYRHLGAAVYASRTLQEETIQAKLYQLDQWQAAITALQEEKQACIRRAHE